MNLFKIFKKQESNIFEVLLRYSNVKYTKCYADSAFDNNPTRNTFAGICELLELYQFDYLPILSSDKSNLTKLTIPFIAQTNCNFVVVFSIDNETVKYNCNEKEFSCTVDEFQSMWTGAAIIIQTNENTAEPNCKQHIVQQFFYKFQEVVFLGIIIGWGVYSYISNSFYKNLGYTILLLLSIAGLYITYLLILKQLHIHSKQADKICSSISKGNCDLVLESSGAKLFGVFGWSEVGFGYFLSNLYIMLFSPQLFSYMVIANICVLPFSFWSVLYQKFKVKYWCPLCLTIQLIFWLTFFVELLFKDIKLPVADIFSILETLSIYLIFVLGINMLVPKLFQDGKDK